MKKWLVVIGLILGLTLILMGVSLILFPGWLNVSGYRLILAGLAFDFAAGLAGKFNEWHDLLFPKREKKSDSAPEPFREQTMTDSEYGLQEMVGKGGRQEQNMDNSPHGTQKIS